MPLGNGFAFNAIFKQAAQERWLKCEFQNVYTPVVTFLALKLRIWLNQKLSRDLGKSTKAVLEKRFLTFVIAISEFCAAWAWDALLEATAEPWWPVTHGAREVGRESVWATFVTLGAISVSVFGGPATLWQLLNKLAGINVGWAWMDLATACFNAISSKDDSNAIVILKVWLLASIYSITLPLFALLLMKLLRNDTPLPPKVQRG
mmetsp:Transcript_90039/g.172549  ORF Transcript_90039/g.172549 Transcript_90039/m.172549 type:complete len:205 (-) Transcript_90039:349-963(-)